MADILLFDVENEVHDIYSRLISKIQRFGVSDNSRKISKK